MCSLFSSSCSTCSWPSSTIHTLKSRKIWLPENLSLTLVLSSRKATMACSPNSNFAKIDSRPVLKIWFDYNLFQLFFKSKKDIQDALDSADTNNDDQVDWDEWRSDLKLRGVPDAEIEAVFAKYDKDGDMVLNKEERNRLRADLLKQTAEINDEIDDVKDRGSKITWDYSRSLSALNPEIRIDKKLEKLLASTCTSQKITDLHRILIHLLMSWCLKNWTR